MKLTAEQISRRLLKAYQSDSQPVSPYPSEILVGPSHPAAVLVPFICVDQDWHLLFIRRTENKHDLHAGQVAFPGGRCDPTDTDIEYAALRETSEEIGINPSDVQILGILNATLTITNYRVTPVVGKIPWPYPLNLHPQEVSRAFTIPLDWLANPNNHEIRVRSLPSLKRSIEVIYFHPYDGEVLWGASARITLMLLITLGFELPSNVLFLR